MKSGKIILGAAAAVVTVAGSLAFRAAHHTNRLAFGATQKGGVNCKQCASVFTGAPGSENRLKCHTANVALAHTLWATRTAGVGSITKAFRTKVTAVLGVKCGSNKVTRTTATNPS